MAQENLTLLLQDQDFIGVIQNDIDIDVDAFYDEVQSNILSQAISQFGLSQIYDEFIQGGSYGTSFNMDKKIYDNDISADQIETYESYKEEYKRDRFNKVTGKNPNHMNLKQRREHDKKHFDSVTSYITGEELDFTEVDYDHIVSIKENTENKRMRRLLSEEEMIKTINHESNISPLERGTNRSKKDQSMKEFLKTEKGKQLSKTEKKNAIVSDIKSRSVTQATLLKKESQEVGKRVVKRGAAQLKKQAIGIIFVEIVFYLLDCTKPVLKRWNSFDSINERFDEILKNFKKNLDSVKARIKRLVSKIINFAVDVYSSSFLSIIIEHMINSITTTSANFSKLFNDGIHSIISSIKILVNKSLPMNERVKAAIKVLGAGLITSLGVIIVENLKLALTNTAFSPFKDEIATLFGISFTGLLLGIFVFAVDNFKEIIQKVSVTLSDAIDSSEKLETAYLKVIDKLDDAYLQILLRIKGEYERIGQLQMMVSDYRLLASEQFDNSLMYARESNVAEEDLLKNKEDIIRYFLD